MSLVGCISHRVMVVYQGDSSDLPVVMIVSFFFFFKQKTAYEIYQCDWSSDVCSSDLADRQLSLEEIIDKCHDVSRQR